MLQVLSEIILSILCVYGGYRLLHDLVGLLERKLMKMRESRAEKQENTRSTDEKEEKGGEDSESNGCP